MLDELLPWSGGTEKTWLACFQFATNRYRGDDLTVTGDGDKDTCKVETGLGFLTIITNPAFYPHYRVWISMAPLFGQVEEGYSPFAMFKLPLFRLTFPDSVR